MIHSRNREFRADLASMKSFDSFRNALDPNFIPEPSLIERTLQLGVAMAAEVRTVVHEAQQDSRLARAEASLAAGQCTMSQIVALTRDGQPPVIYPFKR